MKKRVLMIPAILLLVIVLITSMTIIPTGYTGVKTSFGQVQEETIPSGRLIFTVPFVESIHKVNNKQQDKTVEAQVWGEALDKTPVYAADITVTYQIMPERSVWIYANVSDTKNLVTDSLVASAVKSAMVELGPEEVTNRAKIEPLVQEKLNTSLEQKYGEETVYINKVTINDMDFEDAYNEAIQQRSIAQQQEIENAAAIAKAEAEKRVAITNAEAEAEKATITAEAQAEANRKIAESLSDELIEYQKIQKWDGKLPTVTGGNSLVSIDTEE